MAQITYRASLDSEFIPMRSDLLGRTVIVRGADAKTAAQATSTSAAQDDASSKNPQIFYAHNVVPTAEGLQSVGFDIVAAASGLAFDFTAAYPLYDGAGNTGLLGVTASGSLYVMEYGQNTWTSVGSSTAGAEVTTAFVSGVTYIYVEYTECFKYDFSTHALVSVTLTGLTAATIRGIVGHAGYLLAYSDDALAWSSTIDPTDFLPSLATGAGGGGVEGARGKISAAVPVYGGIIFFTESNAVSAIFQNNTRYPFSFTEITGAGGVPGPGFVSYDTNAGATYAYTTFGLQSLTLRQANSVFPAVTDFLSGNTFEDFDTSTLTFTSQTTTQAVLKRLAVIAGRYLLISYGTSSLTHAIFVDTALKGFGKIKIAHADCFPFALYGQEVVELARKSIGFLGADGSIRVVNFDLGADSSESVLILGKYQYVRSRLLTLETVALESVQDPATFEMYDLRTMDGATFLPATAAVLRSSSARIATYAVHKVALNHSIVCIGKLNAVSLLLTFVPAGSR